MSAGCGELSFQLAGVCMRNFWLSVMVSEDQPAAQWYLYWFIIIGAQLLGMSVQLCCAERRTVIC